MTGLALYTVQPAFGFDLGALFSAPGAQRAGDRTTALTRGPYLQTNTPTSIVIRWRTEVSEVGVVRYGTSPTALLEQVSESEATTEHSVRLDGLSPGTRTYYSVGNFSGPIAGGDAEHTFFTSPPPGAVKDTRIWVVGDSGTANSNAAAVRDSYYNFMGTVHTDLMLMLGDNAYDDGTDAEYQAAVFDMYGAILRKTPLWSTLGNHDGHTANSITQSGPYYNVFTFPTQGEAGGVPSGTEAYYSFDFANIHFVNLNSYDVSRQVDGAMLTWLKADLAETTADWIIAFWHHPPYTKGSHDSDVELELIQMRQYALPMLEAAGVDLILCGHSHSYERSFLLNGHYETSNTLSAEMILDNGNGREDGDGAYHKLTPGLSANEGAVYVVAGSSGKTDDGNLNHPAMYVSMAELGSVALDVSGMRLDLTFIGNLGQTRDYFTLVKGGANLPAAPSALSAQVLSGSEISLSWTDNSQNEDTFEVDRSDDGVTWIRLGVVPANTSTLLDSGLASGATYKYRLRARNADGPSSWSNIVEAITETDVGCSGRLSRLPTSGGTWWPPGAQGTTGAQGVLLLLAGTVLVFRLRGRE